MSKHPNADDNDSVSLFTIQFSSHRHVGLVAVNKFRKVSSVDAAAVAALHEQTEHRIE